MAKLSAHGYEVARIKHRQTIGETNYEMTLSFRSDGHIMRNVKALNIHAHGNPHHVYGWKLWKKLARLGDPGLHDPATRQRDLAAKTAEALRASGDLIDSTI